MLYRVAADFILLTHVAFVLFIVLGLALIYLGSAGNWSWVRNFWFRLSHLLAIAVVMVQAWFGKICPLTTLEMSLRLRAGETTYPGAFIAHWLQTLLYFEAPVWGFALCYTIFGILVAGSWFWIPPQRSANGEESK
jgi:Protein of Unknown function (DUF2784)